ncbi:mechanosensitive ion channel [bacterium]|nr:mechanosensitive ion channel [bacterium]
MQTFIHWFPSRWLAYLVLALGLLLVSWFISYILRLSIGKFFSKNAEKLNLDPTAFFFVKNAVSFIIYLLALIVLFYNIPELNSIGVALFASAGIFAAIAGFASQAALANMISGIMIVIFKPFRVNDHVVVGTNAGLVEDITLRHTVIRNYENRRLVIPNAIMANEVILNSDLVDEKIRMHFEIGIDYNSDLQRAKDILRELVEGHELFCDYRSDEDKENGMDAVPVKVVRIEDSAIVLRAWVWAANPDDAFTFRCDLLEQVKLSFDQNNIDIPYPHRTIVQKK